MNTAVEVGGVQGADGLMQRVTECLGPAHSGKWPECGCCRAAAGLCGPNCAQPGLNCPEPAGSGPRSLALAEGPCRSLAPARAAAGRGR